MYILLYTGANLDVFIGEGSDKIMDFNLNLGTQVYCNRPRFRTQSVASSELINVYKIQSL